MLRVETGQIAAQATPDPAAADAAEMGLPAATESTVTRFVLPTVTPTPPFRSGARRAALTGLTHEWQTWNNCGPATLAMALSYHDVGVGQADIGPVLRPNGEDKNVSPHELADYARAVGLDATVRVNGDAAVVKTLLANGVAGHRGGVAGAGAGRRVRPLPPAHRLRQRRAGVDRVRQLCGRGAGRCGGAYAGITVPYAQLEAQWRVFNRTFVALYPPEQGEVVRFALGDLADDGLMYTSTLARAQRELEANGGDAFAWFNRGSALVGLARYEEAVAAYEQAFAIGLPWRMLWYQFGPLEAYQRTGRYAELVVARRRRWRRRAMWKSCTIGAGLVWRGWAMGTVRVRRGRRRRRCGRTSRRRWGRWRGLGRLSRGDWGR